MLRVRAALIATVVGWAALGSFARANIISCTSCGGTDGPYPISWSVTVDPGITLLHAYYLDDGSNPLGPSNQNPQTVLAAIEALPGLSHATLAGTSDSATYSVGGSNVLGNVYAVHFGGGGQGANFNDLVLQLSGVSHFQVNYVECCGNDGNRFSNIRAFNADPVPGPLLGAGLPGLLAGAVFLLMVARRRREHLA